MGDFSGLCHLRAVMLSCRQVSMNSVEVKTIGSSGQISLGKQFAGRTVTVEQVEEIARRVMRESA